VGVTYRSNSCRPSNSKLPPPPPPAAEVTTPTKPAPSFRDKESYSELFKPLPKPEPIPTLGGGLRVEAKPWKQLQEEREALMTREIEKTKCEALNLWDRAKAEDSKRVNAITTEKQRIEEEARKREEIMARGNAERVEKDKQRKAEIARQEQLLSGRIARAKTEDPNHDPAGRGPGIQIYHYKDPEVEQIVKNTKKEEIRRRMSHGELLRGFNNGNSGNVNNGNNGSFNGSSNGGFNGFGGSNNGSFSGFNNRSLNQGPDVQSQSSNGEETVFFDAQVMLRSTSTSSTTSR